jgi:tRNA nucleotidyltransferase (CCA-adding enzyme)
LPEVDALFGVPEAPGQHGTIDSGVHLARALDWSAGRGGALPARYGILVHDLGLAAVPRAAWPVQQSRETPSVRLAERVSERLKVPLDCGDAARLAARWHRCVHRAAELRPAKLLDLLHATDALRRPARLDTLLDVCAADACSNPGAPQDYPPASVLRGALAVVKTVDAGAIARDVVKPKGKQVDAIAKAVRAARLKALRAWRRTIARA